MIKVRPYPQWILNVENSRTGIGGESFTKLFFPKQWEYANPPSSPPVRWQLRTLSVTLLFVVLFTIEGKLSFDTPGFKKVALNEVMVSYFAC